jgi:hypothetical protein
VKWTLHVDHGILRMDPQSLWAIRHQLDTFCEQITFTHSIGIGGSPPEQQG